MKKQKNYTKKLFFAYSTATLLVLFLLFSIVLVYIYRQAYTRGVETQEQLVAKMEEQMDASLQGMDRIINGMLFNSEFLDIMQEDEAMLHYTRNSKQVQNRFAALDAPLFPTHRIIAFDREVYYTKSKTGEDQLHIKEAMQQYEWWDEVMEAGGGRVLIPPHQDPFEPSEQLVYSAARAINDGKQMLGVIEVQNSYSVLADICGLDASLGSVAVFTPPGGAVYPYTQQPGEELIAALFDAVQERGGAGGSFTLEGRLVSYSVSAYSGWVTVLYNPVGRVVPFAYQLIAVALVAFLLLALATLVLLRIITKRLTAPLVDLNEALNDVSIQNLSLSLPGSKGIQEIENINRSFEAMFSQLNNAIAESIQARANEERASYLALQSQMNPHTIYNTITMIESVSYMNGDKEVSNLCICFSQMLRYISDYTRRDYTVGDEVAHLQNYCVLIMKRYEGLLDINVEVEEGLLDKALPKFTLQPLVENAVKHGFGTGAEKLRIWVQVKSTPDGWHILIEDNGSGFTEESLAEIARQLEDCDESLRTRGDVAHRKIGNLSMSNIYIRCRILFGGAFTLRVGNRQPAGARVRLAVADKVGEGKDEDLPG